MALRRRATQQPRDNKKTITESHYGSNNEQRINNNRTTALERTEAKATGV